MLCVCNIATDTSAADRSTSLIMTTLFVYTCTQEDPPRIYAPVYASWPSETEEVPPLYFNGRVVPTLHTSPGADRVCVGVCTTHPCYHPNLKVHTACVRAAGLARVVFPEHDTKAVPGRLYGTLGTVVLRDCVGTQVLLAVGQQ